MSALVISFGGASEKADGIIVQWIELVCVAGKLLTLNILLALIQRLQMTERKLFRAQLLYQLKNSWVSSWYLIDVLLTLSDIYWSQKPESIPGGL